MTTRSQQYSVYYLSYVDTAVDEAEQESHWPAVDELRAVRLIDKTDEQRLLVNARLNSSGQRQHTPDTDRGAEFIVTTTRQRKPNYGVFENRADAEADAIARYEQRFGGSWTGPVP